MSKKMYYTIVDYLSLYPNYILTLQSSTGEVRYWCIDDVHAEEQILDKYRVRDYVGVVLTELPRSGSWIEKEDIRFL